MYWCLKQNLPKKVKFSASDVREYFMCENRLLCGALWSIIRSVVIILVAVIFHIICIGKYLIDDATWLTMTCSRASAQILIVTAWWLMLLSVPIFSKYSNIWHYMIYLITSAAATSDKPISCPDGFCKCSSAEYLANAAWRRWQCKFDRRKPTLSTKG